MRKVVVTVELHQQLPADEHIGLAMAFEHAATVLINDPRTYPVGAAVTRVGDEVRRRIEWRAE